MNPAILVPAQFRFHFVFLFVPATMVVWALAGSATADGVAAEPSLEQVAKAVERHFSGLDYYEPGDLISRADVQDALDYVAELGWQPPRRAAIEKLVLPENAFLVIKLRTKQGSKFMRKIARLKGAYDRLDRLSAMSGGRNLIDTLIRDKGGHELIEYLATSQGGEKLGRMLARAENGSNMNKPTGRIYTVEALVRVLSKAYEKGSKR